ncbi:MAG: ankyrin repeat protein [Psychroserpens sp.]|jgi:ankyrin repeat protein
MTRENHQEEQKEENNLTTREQLINSLENGEELQKVKYLLKEIKEEDQNFHINAYLIDHQNKKYGKLLIEHSLKGKNYLVINHLQSEGKYTDLHLSIINNDSLNEIRNIIEKRKEIINQKDGGGNYPIKFAVDNKNIEIIRLLVNEYNFDVNKENSRGLSLIHFAAQKGYKEVIFSLVNEFGVDFNKKNLRTGDSPLWIASSYGHKELVEFLMEDLGADPKQTNDKGLTPFHISLFNKHKSVSKYLENHKNHTIDIERALENSNRNSIKIINELETLFIMALEDEINPKAIINSNKLLFKTSNSEVFSYLIGKGGEVNIKDPSTSLREYIEGSLIEKITGVLLRKDLKKGMKETLDLIYKPQEFELEIFNETGLPKELISLTMDYMAINRKERNAPRNNPKNECFFELKRRDSEENNQK